MLATSTTQGSKPAGAQDVSRWEFVALLSLLLIHFGACHSSLSTSPLTGHTSGTSCTPQTGGFDLGSDFVIGVLFGPVAIEFHGHSLILTDLHAPRTGVAEVGCCVD
jgi:hypothetical protein